MINKISGENKLLGSVEVMSLFYSNRWLPAHSLLLSYLDLFLLEVKAIGSFHSPPHALNSESHDSDPDTESTTVLSPSSSV